MTVVGVTVPRDQCNRGRVTELHCDRHLIELCSNISESI